MDRNTLAKILGGIGVALLGVLFKITSSSDFDQKMLALSPDNSDLASLIMFAILGGSVVCLVAAKILYRTPK